MTRSQFDSVLWLGGSIAKLVMQQTLNLPILGSNPNAPTGTTKGKQCLNTVYI